MPQDPKGIDWEGAQENVLSGWKYSRFWPCHWVYEYAKKNYQIKFCLPKEKGKRKGINLEYGNNELKTATHKIDKQQGFTV